jgi:hypothetical protein
MKERVVSTALVPASTVPEPMATLLEQTDVRAASFPLTFEGKGVVVTLLSNNPAAFEVVDAGILGSMLELLTKGWEAGESKEEQEQFLVFASYGVIGALADKLSNEITNHANGALNYSQALLDLSDENKLSDIQRDLLKYLHAEGVRIGEIAGQLHSLNPQSAFQRPKAHLVKLLPEVMRTWSPLLQREGIEIRQEIENGLPEAKVPAGTMLVVVHSLIEMAHQYLLTAGEAETDVQKLICVYTTFNKDQSQIILTITPCRNMSTNTKVRGNRNAPWPDFDDCTRILHAVQGEIRTGKTAEKEYYCTALVPAVSSGQH